MMTRQHFVLFADALAEIDRPHERRRVAELVSRVLADSNPRFDRARFDARIVETRRKIEHEAAPERPEVDPRD